MIAAMIFFMTPSLSFVRLTEQNPCPPVQDKRFIPARTGAQ
jgi:hypothetical protein